MNQYCSFNTWISKKTGCTKEEAQALDYLLHYAVQGTNAKCKHFSEEEGRRIFAKWSRLGIINKDGKVEVESKDDLYLQFLIYANIWSGMLKMVRKK